MRGVEGVWCIVCIDYLFRGLISYLNDTVRLVGRSGCGGKTAETIPNFAAFLCTCGTFTCSKIIIFLSFCLPLYAQSSFYKGLAYITAQL